MAGEPNKLEKEGVQVDGWPQGKEKPMPEQYSEEDPTQVDFYKHFFDTGSRLETVRSPPFVSVAVSAHLRWDVLAHMRDEMLMCSRARAIRRVCVLGCSDLSFLTTERAWAGRGGRTGGG